RPAGARPSADAERALHPLGLVPVDGAVDLVGAVLAERHLERGARSGLDVPALLLDAVPFDLERVRDRALVRDLERVGARLRDRDGARRQRELLFGDLDGFDDGAALHRRTAGAPAAARQ